MKPKYRKRINAWVERHLGDLAPDVLSEEVKWKILFKIEKKRRKKAEKKLQEKHFPPADKLVASTLVTSLHFCYECKNFNGETGKCQLPGTPNDPYYCGLANFY